MALRGAKTGQETKTFLCRVAGQFIRMVITVRTVQTCRLWPPARPTLNFRENCFITMSIERALRCEPKPRMKKRKRADAHRYRPRWGQGSPGEENSLFWPRCSYRPWLLLIKITASVRGSKFDQRKDFIYKEKVCCKKMRWRNFRGLP